MKTYEIVFSKNGRYYYLMYTLADGWLAIDPSTDPAWLPFADGKLNEDRQRQPESDEERKNLVDRYLQFLSVRNP